MRRTFVISLIAFLSISAQAWGVALVYNGPGVCDDYCVPASVEVARMAGLEVRLIQGNELNASSTSADVARIFGDARVWIQPGGIGNYALWSMSQRMRDELRAFIKGGGGFVGFCAGAFMATESIGRRGAAGFGIFPGGSIAYPYSSIRAGLKYNLVPVVWNGVKRMVYLEGGPYLTTSNRNAEIVATYASGAVATARAPYGAGRVYISGLHPEAPDLWTQEDGIQDPDGNEQFLAVEMIRWSARI